MRLRASEIAAATGGTLRGPDVEVDGASIDSRTVPAGALFVPVVAERDGHDFIGAAVAGGATAYLTQRTEDVPGATAIGVASTAGALLDVGRLARMGLPERVIGITGSVGKTSTKDLLAAVLRTSMVTAASERSFNNELGVPLTLANAPDNAEAVIVEMGARGPGHIKLLCDIARPTVGIVTSVAAAHLEMFGSLEGVARAKSELVAALPESGTAVLFADDDLVLGMAKATRALVLTYGMERGEVRARSIELDAELRPSFVLESPWGRTPVQMAARGVHQVANALGAASAALACGVTPEAVAHGLGQGVLSGLRMELVTTPDGALLLNDSYNANPASTLAALDALAALEAKRHVAVLGPMAELGPDGPALHRSVLARADGLGIRVISVGAPDYGVTGADATTDIDQALQQLGSIGDGDALLVKGSRVAGLERLASALLSP